MSDLTPEELELLQAADEPEAPVVVEEEHRKPRTRKKVEAAAPAAAAEAPAAQAPARGPFTPVQFHDDGWNGLPVQMRG